MSSSSTDAKTLGLTSVSTWTNPYSTYPSCTKPFMTLVSDINPSYDSDVPGSTLGTDAKPATDIGFDFASIGATLWSKEVGGSASVNIGQSGSTSDSAPTAKTATSFATIRGLAEEPTRQGSYSSAAVTYFGSQNVITTAGSNKVQSFSIALSSTLPNIKITTSKGTVKFVPFSMDVSLGVVSQITGFYVDTLTKDSSGNISSISFRVVYDDSAQGSDYDMDAIVLYTVTANSDGTVSVTSKTEYSVAAYESHMGYTMSGTTKDGVYLEVTGGGGGTTRYKLDTPDGKYPGDCTSATCAYLPGLANNSATISGRNAYHTRTFTPSSSTSVTTLQDPLWYAAKYGKTDLTDWDADGDGTPDNYFLVSNPSELATQLKTAFDEILQLNSSITAPAVDSSTTDSGSYVYRTTLSTSDWSGDVIKQLSTTSGTTTTVWKASAQLTPSSRNVLFNSSGTLKSFLYTNLSTAQKAYLDKAADGTVDSKGSARVNFIRGTLTSDPDFPSRSTLIGDIVNSSPVLVSGADYLSARADALEGSSNYAAYATQQAALPEMVYVGANDGMLHAFNASTGAEVFAFVPTTVIPNLNILTASDYGQDEGTEHHYFVDGTPEVSDVYYGGAWHKVLIGTMGAGGREVFALDITTPSSPTLLWDYTSDDDADLGYSVAKPTITRLHDGKWVALVPNGYDSGTSKAVLYVVQIQTGTLLAKLTATPTLTTADTPAVDSQGNGLSRVYAADVNSDGIADYAYAGDLYGDLWRFDLVDTSASAPLTATATDSKFAVSFGGNPLYVARDASGTRQPITAAPVLVSHPSGTGYIVAFGTGRYLTTSDKTSTKQQSMYGIWDRKTAGEATTTSLTSAKTRSNLQVQTLTATTVGTTAAYTMSSSSVSWYDSSGNTADANVNKWGWYYDFPNSGERLIYDMTLYGSALVFNSSIPQTGSCEAGLSAVKYGIDPSTGGATNYAVFDVDGDGVYDSVSGFATSGGDSTLSGGYAWGSTPEDAPVAVSTGIVSGRRTWQIQPANN
ncbi:MAG: Type IV pilus biogenesis factor PilY1 [Pseudomonas citronellolis]|nr:MAG: Type IV pilus biogenesis factor PilY1 [Pseudomonas citronellolis]